MSYHFNHRKNDKNFKYNYEFNNDQIATNFKGLPCYKHSSECFLYLIRVLSILKMCYFHFIYKASLN